MNQVTQIHLDRQSFTISVEAQKALKNYLAAIEGQVGDKSADVIKEVELRMAELLVERGITNEKVVLAEDIEYLKEQLGEPSDFKDDNSEESINDETEAQPTRRLFRDTENGMLAGVSSGLANYFGVDVLLVRIIFVVAILTGGWGILVYILLWLLVPEAKTSSERLQMRGVAVTIDNLKKAVERADVQAATQRAGHTITTFVNSIFRTVLRLVGVAFTVSGLGLLFASLVIGAYIAGHSGKLFEENLFPIGRTESALLYIYIILIGLAALFVVLLGLAIFRRKWPIKTWITGVLIGIFFVGFAISVAITADVAPKVRNRYQASLHSSSRELKPFSNVDLIGGNIGVEYQYGPTYSLKFEYIDYPDLTKITTNIIGDRLEINTQDFTKNRNCTMLCLFPDYNLRVIVYSPTSLTISGTDLINKIPPENFGPKNFPVE